MVSSNERDSRLLDHVRSAGFVSIEDLSQSFGLTPQTIRRVVNRLSEEGRLKRSHGGVQPLPENRNLEYRARQVLHLQEKTQIARHVARFVPDGASLFIGLGTTPECVAVALARHRDLRVFTNSLNVAAALAANPQIEIAIAGGALRRRDRDVIGAAAVAFFGRYKVDLAIFGVGGVDEDGGLLDFDEGEVEARQAMVEGSRTAILVADHSKFGRSVPVRGGTMGEVDHLFTDRPPSAAFLPAILDGKVTIHDRLGEEPSSRRKEED
jgi:DeoR family glycerol-3-phosphate regulon repressor